MALCAMQIYSREFFAAAGTRAAGAARPVDCIFLFQTKHYDAWHRRAGREPEHREPPGPQKHFTRAAL